MDPTFNQSFTHPPMSTFFDLNMVSQKPITRNKEHVEQISHFENLNFYCLYNIFSKLNNVDGGSFSKVNKQFYFIWKEHSFLAKMQNFLPNEIVKKIGVRTLINIPVMEVKHKEDSLVYPDEPVLSQLISDKDTPPIVIGKVWNIKFIALRVRSLVEGDNSLRSIIFCTPLHWYGTNPGWQVHSFLGHYQHTSPLSNQSIDYLNRLIKGEHCGVFTTEESPERALSYKGNIKSIVELDQPSS